MFTGIIEELGLIQHVSNQSDIHQYKIKVSDGFISDIKKGDSIAVNGVCLTAYQIENNQFYVDVSEETQSCTNFANLINEEHVNLERAVMPTTRLGGHFVSGHVDGMGSLSKRDDKENESILWFTAPDELLKYIAVKGSVCINGVSLTVNLLDNKQFCVTIIPHTLNNTTLKFLQVGDKANIEVDLIARYLEQIIQTKD